MSYRGNVGEYLGVWLGGLFGTAGSILFLLFISATVLVFAFDVKIENIYHFIKNMFASAADSKIEINKDDEDSSNLEKIKKLGKEKKKPVIVEEDDLSAEELMEEEAEAQTQIQIIRKAETEVMEENEISVSDRKKVDLEKTGELPTKKKLLLMMMMKKRNFLIHGKKIWIMNCPGLTSFSHQLLKM